MINKILLGGNKGNSYTAIKIGNYTGQPFWNTGRNIIRTPNGRLFVCCYSVSTLIIDIFCSDDDGKTWVKFGYITETPCTKGITAISMSYKNPWVYVNVNYNCDSYTHGFMCYYFNGALTPNANNEYHNNKLLYEGFSTPMSTHGNSIATGSYGSMDLFMILFSRFETVTYNVQGRNGQIKSNSGTMQSWSNAHFTTYSSSSTFAENPSAAIDSENGRLIAAYILNYTSHYSRINCTYKSITGSWAESTPTNINGNDSIKNLCISYMRYSVSYKISSSSSYGVVLLTWQQSEGNVNNIHFKVSLTTSQNISSWTTLGGIEKIANVTNYSNYSPSIQWDYNGNIYVLWVCNKIGKSASVVAYRKYDASSGTWDSIEYTSIKAIRVYPLECLKNNSKPIFICQSLESVDYYNLN